MIILVAFVVAFLTGNPLFALFGMLWWLFNLLDKKTTNQINLTNNYVTGVKEL